MRIPRSHQYMHTVSRMLFGHVSKLTQLLLRLSSQILLLLLQQLDLLWGRLLLLLLIPEQLLQQKQTSDITVGRLTYLF